ncbi:MerR family transcriptional regulator [Streptomyces tsukubensis]|uniref:MerR family transcriptional regulator n=1 Tax=Streptomyces tsukubensis TaxID=83656 RepID=UPI00344D0FE9
MRIGELSRRTDTSPRLLRYYEEQGLIAAARSPNGYRDYEDGTVDRVLQIRGLLDAGLPTRIIRRILPCLGTPRTIYFPDPTPEMLSALERERDRMTERIAVLSRNRDAIDGYLTTVRRNDAAAAIRAERPEDVRSGGRTE